MPPAALKKRLSKEKRHDHPRVCKAEQFSHQGQLTRIPDEVEYDFNDRPHNCKRYVDEDFNEYGIHEDGFIVAIPCEKAWGFSTKEKSRIAAMIEKERQEAAERRMFGD